MQNLDQKRKCSSTPIRQESEIGDPVAQLLRTIHLSPTGKLMTPGDISLTDRIERRDFHTVFPKDEIFSAGYTAGDAWDQLHRMLAGRVGKTPPLNHEFYVIYGEGNQKTIIQFSDLRVAVASDFELQRY